jgi:elongator complex protein 2
MALTSDGKVLATACKARDMDHSIIILWDTRTSLAIDSLKGHESTVVCLRFTQQNDVLASSGKDRCLCVHRLASGADGYAATTLLNVKKAHKRIIWDCRCTDEYLLAVSVFITSNIAGQRPVTPL